MIRKPKFLYGIHDEEGRDWIEEEGWLICTRAIGCDPSSVIGSNFHFVNSKGAYLVPIVRLNYSYGGGTIGSLGQWTMFAKTCAEFVRKSSGAHIWIIGNEPNHPQEWVDTNMPYRPWEYASCFNRCYQFIKDAAPDDEVIVAPVAPWCAKTTYRGNESGDWVEYWRDMLDEIEYADGLALHTYTHGPNPNLIWAETYMSTFPNRHYDFKAYQDFLYALEDDDAYARFRRLPVYITETNQTDPWENNTHSLWISAAYNEINWWNSRLDDTQRINCLALYRYHHFPNDQWGMQGNDNLRRQFELVQHAQHSSALSGLPSMGTKPDDDTWTVEGKISVDVGEAYSLIEALEWMEQSAELLERATEIVAGMLETSYKEAID